MAPPDTRTLEWYNSYLLIISRGGGRCHFNMINRQLIIYFTVKKYKKKKKRICCCYKGSMFIFTFFTSIGGNCPLSRYIVVHIHFPSTSRIMLRF